MWEQVTLLQSCMGKKAFMVQVRYNGVCVCKMLSSTVYCMYSIYIYTVYIIYLFLLDYRNTRIS